MKKTERFRWAFIGAGSLAHSVAKEVTRSGRHEIVSVYTHTPEKCREFAASLGAKAAVSAEEAIGLETVDGVYVVTPHSSHVEYASLAIQMGKPVLCEKPLTIDLESTEKLLRLAEEKHVYLSEGMWTWFSPVAHQVKAWLDAGEYGDLQKIYAGFHMIGSKKVRRLWDPALGGGAILDIGVYPITYLYRLFGMPVSVTCKAELRGGVDIRDRIEMTFANGMKGQIGISLVDFWGLEGFCLKGNKASTNILFCHSANHAKLVRRNGPNEHFHADGSICNEFDCVAREVRTGQTESLLVPHKATLDVMKLMEECMRQAGMR